MVANVQIYSEKTTKKRRKKQKAKIFVKIEHVIAEFYVTLQPVTK
jgi:hypothetical protein